VGYTLNVAANVSGVITRNH